MGSLILCHKKRAVQPYEITRVHLRVYTIEELCYYVCNNLYLIDNTFMNRRLCDWIGKELEMNKLSMQLHEELSKNCTEVQFVLTLLRGSNIYAVSEINKVQAVLDQLQNQKEVQKAKYKADTLLGSGEYSAAVLVYQSIINQKWDDSMETSFYGKVYACLGTAYGRQFLYEEACAAYKEAYRFLGDPAVLKAYLYSCYRAYPRAEYVKMLSGNSLYLSMDGALKAERRRIHEITEQEVSNGQMEVWKSEYRKNDRKKKGAGN